MYDIQLEINGKKLRMNPGSGYYISTISGLTGVTANQIGRASCRERV